MVLLLQKSQHRPIMKILQLYFLEKKIAEDNFDDDFEWDRIPAGWGPINEEEAIARIEAIEADIEQNGLIDEEDMIEHLKAKGLWLI